MISPSALYTDELRSAPIARLLELALRELNTAGGEDRSDSEKITFACECLERARVQLRRRREIVVELTLAQAQALHRAADNSLRDPDAWREFVGKREAEAAFRASEELGAAIFDATRKRRGGV